jgi:RNA recognition motif-containing protein
MMDRASDKSLGYGFVDYAEPEAAQAAIDAVNGMR